MHLVCTAAMSLAAEDEEQAMRFPFNSSQSTRGRAQRQQHFATRPRLSSRALREPSASLTDPFAVLHPTMLLGNMHSALDADPHAASAIMAALMADYDESSGASHIGAAAGTPFWQPTFCTGFQHATLAHKTTIDLVHTDQPVQSATLCACCPSSALQSK